MHEVDEVWCVAGGAPGTPPGSSIDAEPRRRHCARDVLKQRRLVACVLVEREVPSKALRWSLSVTVARMIAGPMNAAGVDGGCESLFAQASAMCLKR